MQTYKITNIVPNLNTGKMVVFYEFSNGEVFSNTIDINTPVSEIQQWGKDKCDWFDEREVMIEEMKQQLLEEPIIEE